MDCGVQVMLLTCVQGCVAVYPAGRPDGVEVRGSDLARLDDDEFLNDTVIDLYIRCTAALQPCAHAHAGLAAVIVVRTSGMFAVHKVRPPLLQGAQPRLLCGVGDLVLICMQIHSGAPA